MKLSERNLAGSRRGITQSARCRRPRRSCAGFTPKLAVTLSSAPCFSPFAVTDCCIKVRHPRGKERAVAHAHTPYAWVLVFLGPARPCP